MGTSKEFQSVKLSDRFMFGEVMRDPTIAKEFLESLLDCKIARVEVINKEQEFSDTINGRGVRLDVYLADEKGTRYNVEMQNERDFLEKRSRYYQSLMDRHALRPGQTFDQISQSYIIFVCNYDHFGLGLAKYERELRLKGTDVTYDDGSHIIFLNTKYKECNVPVDVADFLHCLNDDAGASNETRLVQEIKQRLHKVRNDSAKEEAYMTFEMCMNEQLAKGIEQGIAQGAADTLRENVKNLLKILPVEKVAEGLNKPLEEIRTIAASIQEAEG